MLINYDYYDPFNLKFNMINLNLIFMFIYTIWINFDYYDQGLFNIMLTWFNFYLHLFRSDRLISLCFNSILIAHGYPLSGYGPQWTPSIHKELHGPNNGILRVENFIIGVFNPKSNPVLLLARFGYRRVRTTTSRNWRSCCIPCSPTSTSGSWGCLGHPAPPTNSTNSTSQHSRLVHSVTQSSCWFSFLSLKETKSWCTLLIFR